MKTTTIGTKFWLWKVIDIIVNNQRQFWKVQCDCGEIRTVRASNVYNGRSRSCGSLECVLKTQELNSHSYCLNDEYPMKIGDKFKQLTIINTAEPSIHGKKRYVTECDCGRISVESAHDLYTGRRGSCGVVKYDLEIGQQFGELTVTSIDPNNKSNITTTCSCGEIEQYTRKQLLSKRFVICSKEKIKQKKTRIVNIGDVFGKLKIISQVDSSTIKRNNHKFYNCLCECSNTTIKRADALLDGISTHCGCSRRGKKVITKPKQITTIPNPRRAAAARKSHEARRLKSEERELLFLAKEKEKNLAKASKISEHINKPITSIFDFLIQTTK